MVEIYHFFYPNFKFKVLLKNKKTKFKRIKNMQITYTVAYFPTLKEVEEYRTISK